ncbi:unnamed protein product [Adineta ricciae]|uniref:Uncharacterized protein n=1 Tax=Adineta ricciae TaxID=249248 RepID=A0A814DZL2_ADIRI|nr:unnamed protein product [Adineta ricciae]CAF1056116.1 unnamed protein product [Adineta ricciae]
MNAKSLSILLLVFGLLFTLAQCGRLTKRSYGEDADDDSNGNENENDNGADDNSVDDDADLRAEKRAIRAFLENENDASEFLDRSSRLFSDQKSHMKEAKKKYEEKCERLLHPRYCPDLATWPAWNQAFNSATGKK